MTAPSLPPLSPMATLRWAAVDRLLDRAAPTSVLEIGCGQGGAGARLAARYAYLGVEPDARSSQVAMARITPFGGEVRQGSIDAVEPGRRFDLVCSFEVLEHIEDDTAALRSWATHIRPGGTMLLSVPAWPDRFGPSDIEVGHFRRYTPAALADRMRDAGLVEVHTVLYGWPLGFALERVRNQLSRRRMGDSPGLIDREEATASSGRLRQPPAGAAGFVRLACAPFAALQARRPGAGTGLLATATLR